MQPAQVVFAVVVCFTVMVRKHSCASAFISFEGQRSTVNGKPESPAELGLRRWNARQETSRVDRGYPGYTSSSRHKPQPLIISSLTAADDALPSLRVVEGDEGQNKSEADSSKRTPEYPRMVRFDGNRKRWPGHHSLRFLPKVSGYLNSSFLASRKSKVIRGKRLRNRSEQIPGTSTDDYPAVSSTKPIDYGTCEIKMQHKYRCLRESQSRPPASGNSNGHVGEFAFYSDCHKFCHCCKTDIGVVANCSGHYGLTLDRIPRLPNDTIGLDFTHNDITYINSSFFDDVPYLRYLDLSSNKLVSLNESAFAPLIQLEQLMMNDNIELRIVQPASATFRISSLELLSLNGIIADSLPSEVFDHMPHLHCLFMVGVNLRKWNVSAFQRLGALQRLSLDQNDMRYIIMENVNTFHLNWLDMGYNDIFHFPDTCRSGNASIFPRLYKLNLTHNHITQLNIPICLPNLTTLDLASNPIRHLVTNMFGYEKFPSLSSLFIEHLEVWQTDSYAFNNTSLQYLSLMYNYIDFVNENVQFDSMHGLPNLRHLQLEQNYLNNDRFIQLFGHLTTLRSLYIGNTYFDEVTTETFASFPNLTNLTMHRNFFWKLPDGAFDGLTQLERLDISNSKVTTIGENTFGADLQRRFTHLDLSGNNFHCNCDLLWFRDWLRKYKDTKFKYSWTEYRCWNMPDTRVLEFSINQQVCLMSRGTSQIIMVVVSFLLLILALVAVVFRYRWHIRLMLYETFRGKSHNYGLPSDYFRYDIFVCYADEDLDWVVEHLIPELEVRQGVRLCIHQRDFMPGENIVDNIFQSVQRSRRLLMVFSRHFAHSQWCQFELALCLSHVVDNGETLLVVCVDNITSGGDMTPTMMAVMHTTTYIQWSDGTIARASFWDRLKICLR